jgi:hypothetical protein
VNFDRSRVDGVSLDLFLYDPGLQDVVTIHPTLEQQQDPRFIAFREWFREVNEAAIRSDLLARGPGNVTFF